MSAALNGNIARIKDVTGIATELNTKIETLENMITDIADFIEAGRFYVDTDGDLCQEDNEEQEEE